MEGTTRELIEEADEVYWTDPDDGVASGYGMVLGINGEVYSLLMRDGGQTEALEHELS